MIARNRLVSGLQFEHKFNIANRGSFWKARRTFKCIEHLLGSMGKENLSMWAREPCWGDNVNRAAWVNVARRHILVYYNGKVRLFDFSFSTQAFYEFLGKAAS